MDDFVIARNPEPESTLPYLVRLPLGRDGVVLKVRDTWPRTAKVYCHPSEWPAEPEIVERVPVRSCRRRGAAVDLVLDRHRENRSQFVFTRARGREMIFWQTARTAKQARPAAALPTARASGRVLTVLVDSRERYPWTFSHQQAETERQALAVGDYAVLGDDGGVAAVVERKSLADLVSTITGGKLRYLLSGLEGGAARAAVVVEDRWSAVFKLDRVRPAVIAQAVGEAQVSHPSVPIVFAESRQLAQEWTYRFFGAAVAWQADDGAAQRRLAELPAAGAVPVAEPSAAEIRTWARSVGLEVGDKGRIPKVVREAWRREHG